MLKDSDIRTQVEYYLSDGNLTRDQFFNSKLREDPNGYVDLQCILNCNKIKSMAITKDAIVAAVKDSTEVELDESASRIRRKGNKPVPECTAKSVQKKLKIEPAVSIGKRTDGPATNGDAHKAEHAEEEDDGEVQASGEFIPLILFIKETSHLDKVIGKEFERDLSEKIGIEVAFARIGKYDGNVVLDRSLVTQEIADNLLEKGFEYQGQKVQFEVGNDKDKKEFMRNHGRHIGKIILKSKISR
jgi:La domain